jgi:branched-chain amino acid aminotransferase
VLFTPPLSTCGLAGITRDSVITLAADLGLEVREQDIPREALYVADELFFTGTAAEITPIRSVDKTVVGAGRRGPITARLQQAFFDYINGSVPHTHNWLLPLEVRTPAHA